MCINETLRIMPSARNSTFFCLTEEVTLGGAKIKANQDMIIQIYLLHTNPKQWIEPLKYVPERFDPESKWSLTPAGTKRHPMSFGPFLGGKRICIGKTFAESIARVILPQILGQLDFELVDPKYKTFNPLNSMILDEPTTLVKVSLA